MLEVLCWPNSTLMEGVVVAEEEEEGLLLAEALGWMKLRLTEEEAEEVVVVEQNR